MTINSEQIQSLRAACLKAVPGDRHLSKDGSTVLSDQCHPIAKVSDGFHRMLSNGNRGEDAEFFVQASPKAILSLLAERDADKALIAEQAKRIAELATIRAAAEKLVRCKGRYHSEQNYRALAALFGVSAPDLPPLDSEARTLTVKLPKLKMLEDYLAEVAEEERRQIIIGVKLEFHRLCKEACAAAGITLVVGE